MANVEVTSKRLEEMGIEACETLEQSIGKAGRRDKVAESLAQLVLIGDGNAQLELDTAERTPDAMGDKWVASITDFIEKGISLGRLSPSMAKLPLLTPRFREVQVLEWLEVRQELFEQNPGYHGPRFGTEYAEAVASGRLALNPVIPAPVY